MSDPVVSVRSTRQSPGASYDVDPWTLDLDDRFAGLLDARREIARLQAREARFIAAIADDPRIDSPAPVVEKQYVRDELRAALGESAVSVTNRIESARTLVHRLPGTLDAVEAGVLTMRHAGLLSDGVCGLPDADATVVEQRCIDFAEGRDLSAFARKIRREVVALDSRSAEEKLADNLAKLLKQRRVWSYPDPSCAAMAGLGAMLPAEGAQALMMALDVAADRKEPDETRSKDQRRADALVQLGIDALNRFETCSGCRGHRTAPGSIVFPDDNDTAGSDLPRPTGLRPSIQVSVALSTLTGQDNEPAELDGHGPIPAAPWPAAWRQRPTRANSSTTAAPPTNRQQPYATSLSPATAPADTPPATDQPAAARSTTSSPGNTAALPTNPAYKPCAAHHHFKHDNNWTIQRQPDGTTIWTNPSRHNLRRRPGYLPHRPNHRLSCGTTIEPADPNADAA